MFPPFLMCKIHNKAKQKKFDKCRINHKFNYRFMCLLFFF